MANDLRTLAVQTMTEQTEQANAIATRVAESSSNVNRQIRDLRTDENTTDENVRKYQEHAAKLEAALESARSQIDDYLAQQIGADRMTDEERDNLRDEYKSLREARKSTEKWLSSQPGFEPSWLADVPELLNFSGKPSGSTGGTGTGGRRPRLSEATVNGEPITKPDGGRPTFSVLAEHISKASGDKVRPRDLQEAAFQEAGTDDLSTVTDVDFRYSVNGQDFAVVVIPQRPEDNEGGDTPSGE